MLSKLTSFQPYALSFLRIVAGFLFLLHGGQKWFGWFGGLGGAAAPGGSLLWAAGVIETIGAAFILAGLFTRPVAFILSGQMAVAYFTAHFPHGSWPISNGGELAVLYSFLFLFLSTAGGGAWSLDALRGRGSV